MSATTILASGEVPAPRERLFARLCDLDAHRGLAAPHIAILSLRGPQGARTGGDVELRGPAGIRLRATTAVHAATYPRELRGAATTDDGTTATLSWRLDDAGARTRVTARLSVEPRRPLDRLLLAAGGRLWLRLRLRTAIRRLAAA
jgi:hypothetical protein